MTTTKQAELKSILINAESIDLKLSIDDAVIIYCESKYALDKLITNPYTDWINVWLEHIVRLIDTVSPKIAAALSNPSQDHDLRPEDVESLSLEIKLIVPAYTAYLLMGLLHQRLADPTCEVKPYVEHYIETLRTIITLISPAATDLMGDLDFSEFQSQQGL